MKEAIIISKCQRCGRELKDPNAIYGWRCAEELGYSEKNPEVKPDKWNELGYRVIYDEGNKLLKRLKVDAGDIDQNMFYNAFSELYVAEFYGDFKTWEKAFWRIVTALNPGFDKNWTRLPASTNNMGMDVYVSVLQALDSLGLRKLPSVSERYDQPPDYSYTIKTTSIPDYSSGPIDPSQVLEQMVVDEDTGSWEFWTEELDIYGKQSRMET